MKLKFVYILCILVFIFHRTETIEEVPSFRIIAPQNICKQDSNATALKLPDGITVSFQPKDGFKLSYKFRIFFKTIGPEIFTQRETLIVWKAVRALEQRLNTKDRLTISKDNMVFISKAEVVAGVSYIFHVYGITDAGETTKEQVFTIQYSNGVFQNENVPEGINLLLIGSETTVAASKYSLHAKVSFCKPKFNYFIRWKIHNLDEEFQELQHVTATTLNIPKNVFEPESSISIEALVLEVNSSRLLAKDSIDISVVSRGLQTHIIPCSAKIGVNKPLSFQLFIRDFDNEMENIEIYWEYFDMDDVSEIYTDIQQRDTKFIVTFPKPARYQVVANIKFNEKITKEIAEVEVVSNIFLSYDFSHVPNLNPATNSSFHLSVLVTDLIPECKAGWTCAQEEGFKYINQDDIGKDNFGHTEVSNLEKNFLTEIADFGNSTVNREIVLKIPAPSMDNTRWKGLQGDVRYKFRLDAVCPMAYSEVETSKQLVTSHFEFIINTNSPPAAGKIEIRPYKGTALRTVFQISASSGKDLLLDSPITYELCGNFDGSTICFGEYLEYKSWDSVLPYTNSPIKLFVKICDIRGACNIIYGDPLSIDYTTITDTEFNIQKEIVKSAFIRTDYETAHNLIFMAALTYKNADLKRYNEWRDYIKDIMHKEINKLVEHPTTQFYISHNEIIQFVSRAKNNLELLDLNDPSTLEKLLEVLDQITTVSANNDIASQTDAQGKNLEMLDRYRSYSGNRYTNNKVKTISVDLAYVEMNLQLIQDILKSRSSNGSTDNIKVTERVNALVEKMCYSELILNENIKTNFASISISKMTGNYLLKKEFSISAIHTKEEGSFKIRQANLISETTPYCVSIVQYTEDFFTNQNNYVINLAVFDLKILTSVLDWKANEAHQDPHTHSLQIKLAKSKSDENICLSRRNRNSAWVTDNCKVKAVSILHVFCSCFYLGYFRLSAIKNNHDNGISFRPSPTKNIISFPNDNHITPNIFLSSTSEATTPALFTMAAVPSQNISNIATTMYVTRQELRTTTPANHKIDADIEKGYIKTAKPNESVKKASPLIYAIPVALLLIIAIVFVFLMILYRRRPKKSNASTIPGLNIQLESRQRQAGIKYATIYDQHLVRGSF